MSLGAAFGGAIAWLTLANAQDAWVRLLAGVTVLFAALTLGASPSKTAPMKRVSLTGIGSGVIAGIMTYQIAMPGPLAIWALRLRVLDAQQIRATLAAFFLLSYGFIAAIRFDGASAAIAITPWLAAPTLVGALVGRHAARKIDYRWLMRIVKVLLSASGASLIVSGALAL